MYFDPIEMFADVVFVIDSTGGMDRAMPHVRDFARRFLKTLAEVAEEYDKPIGKLRTRIVDFSDYGYEGEDALHQTDFFVLPDEADKFDAALEGIEYECRGGDIPENGLEALYYAMKSNWYEGERNERGRHVIVLISDAPPLRLHEREGCIGYPSDEIPENISELEEMWCAPQEAGLKLTRQRRRMILLVPEECDLDGRTWRHVAEWEYPLSMNFERIFEMPDEAIRTLVYYVLGAM